MVDIFSSFAKLCIYIPILYYYRPVSKLPFIGKLMERCVIDQLMDHIHANNLMEPLQSAYKSYHSTETALLKVKADILKAMDNQEVICLVLLDLSATFDTVDHKILLNGLENHFGIKGMALQWIKLYLTNRSQRVVIRDTNTTGAKSESISLKFGVPQGSVLGPILFTLYMHPLCQILPIRFSTIFMQMTSRSTSASNQGLWGCSYLRMTAFIIWRDVLKKSGIE